MLMGIDIWYPNLPLPKVDSNTLFQGVGLFLAILVPLAIAIVDQSMHLKSKNDPLSTLKMNVVLDESSNPVR